MTTIISNKQRLNNQEKQDRSSNQEVLKKLNKSSNKISKVDYSERVLLISHCLRPSKKCPAKFDENGLNCINCENNCAIGQLKKAAEELNYKGVCIAPGGSLAVKFVEKTLPKAIVAVACKKELIEGSSEVKKRVKKTSTTQPIITTIPLSKDGCVDTQVDIEKALKVLKS